MDPFQRADKKLSKELIPSYRKSLQKPTQLFYHAINQGFCFSHSPLLFHCGIMDVC